MNFSQDGCWVQLKGGLLLDLPVEIGGECGVVYGTTAWFYSVSC